MKINSDNTVSRTVVTVTSNDDHVYLQFYESNEGFRDIVKSNGYKWSYQVKKWKKQLSFRSVDIDNMQVEICCLLLCAGFNIEIDCLLDRIKTNDYEPECKRWICVNTKYPNMFSITWDRNNNCYKAAKKIHKSKYKRPGILIPIESLMEMIDFANMYHFKLSPAAIDLIDDNTIKIQWIEHIDGEITVLNIPENETVQDEFIYS